MTKSRVYIETTIPSFYLESRIDTATQARRDWTRQWWDEERQNYKLVTSVAVLEEIDNGEYPKKAQSLAMMAEIPLIVIQSEIVEIVQVYIEHKVMPDNPLGDALHLAIASFHKCDFLLTWNCKHLANANKFGHIRRINGLLGLYVPSLVTPLELLQGE